MIRGYHVGSDTMRITITNILSDLWGSPEDLASMSDEEIVDLIQEDVPEFLEGATWTITREETK
jgi:hypothetical protein